MYRYKHLFAVTLALVSGVAPSLVLPKDAAAMVAESSTEQDRANLKVVKAFFAAWKDAERGSDYLAPNASVRLEEDKPPLIGKKAYLERWGALEPGQTLVPQLRGFYARNPVVVVLHTDTLKTPGKPDQTFSDSAVIVVKDGKIVEFTDYLQK